MLGEPPRTQYDLNFWLFGIPVRIHPFFWVVGLIFSGGAFNIQNTGGIVFMLAGITAFTLTILVHELAHACVLKFSYREAPWIVLYGFGGLTLHRPGYGKEPGTWGNILISAAGPFSGFIIIGIVAGIIYSSGGRIEIDFHRRLFMPVHPIFLSETYPQIRYALFSFVSLLGTFCIVWGILNLLPIYPLDGGNISRELFLRFTRRNGIVYSLRLSIATAGGIGAYALYNWLVVDRMKDIPFLPLFFLGFAYMNYKTLERFTGRYR